MSLQHVSLFAGVGGADLGFAAAGIPTVAAVEIDAWARGVLAHRFPGATLFSDVRKVSGDDLRAAGAVPGRTVLSGGFPCQPFSVAGHRRGMDGDHRGDLWWEIVRLLVELRPRWIVAENVPGLLSIDGGRTMGAILKSLGDSGYGFCYRVLDAQWFGVPQRRRRVFIVGRAGDDRRPVQVLLEPEGGSGDPAPRGAVGPGTTGGPEDGAGGPGVYGQHGFGLYGPGVKTLQATDHKRAEDNLVVSALTTNMAGGGGGADDNTAQAGHLVPWVKAARAQTDSDDETWREGDVAPTLNVFDNNSEARATVLAVGGTIAHTLRAEGKTPIVRISNDSTPVVGNDMVGALKVGTGLGIPSAPAVHVGTSTVRRLTPTECERLMGWPDGHTAERVDFRTGRVVGQADSSRYRQCGNGMAAPVVEWIARRILAVEEGTL